MSVFLLVPGTVLQQRYRVQSLLGQGGMGAVYLAHDLRLAGRVVAVKENFDSSPAAQSQFSTEAGVLARLSHASLPSVTDFFIEPSGRQYLVMDYVAGEDLETLARRRGPLAEEQVLTWLGQVMDALEYMHRQSPPVIHRDIKPANIKLSPEGRAVLVDFGLVKHFVPGRPTTVGARAVTPGFSPPEQYGQGATDPRSDVYALGATFYALLTGQAPPESVSRLAGESLPSLRVLAPRLSPHVERAVLWAMELEATRRPQSVADLRGALRPPVVVAPKPVALVCRRCGSSNSAGSRYCSGCGASLSRLPASTAGRPVPLLAVAGSVVVVAIVLTALIALRHPAGGTATPVSSAGRSQGVPLVTATRLAASAGPTPTLLAPAATATPLEPSPTPLPARLAFASNKEGSYDLYVMDLGSSSVTRLTTGSREEWGAAWSPDGSQIAFTSNSISTDTWQISVMTDDGVLLRQVTDLAANARFPAWSPDGWTIAFNSRDSSIKAYIWTIGVWGDALTQLTFEPNSGRPAWSPDGRRIAFNGTREDTNGDGQVNDGDRYSLYLINPDGSHQTRLTSDVVPMDRGPVWSPDGDRLAFVRMQYVTGTITATLPGDIYVINADGTGLVNLTASAGEESDVTWCRGDGRLIYVVGGSSDSLWIMDADGSNKRQILADWGQIMYPACSP